MHTKTIEDRLREASDLLSDILDCFVDPEPQQPKEAVFEDARTFLDEEYWQDFQRAEK